MRMKHHAPGHQRCFLHWHSLPTGLTASEAAEASLALTRATGQPTKAYAGQHTGGPVLRTGISGQLFSCYEDLKLYNIGGRRAIQFNDLYAACDLIILY